MIIARFFSEESLGQCDPAVEFGDRIGWNINLLSRDEEYKNVPKTRGDSVEYVSCQINDQLTPYCLGLTLRVPFWQRDVGLQARVIINPHIGKPRAEKLI